MKKIYITEEQKKKLNLLMEDKEGKNLAKARHYLQNNGYSPEQSQQIVDSIRTDIPNSRLQQCKFILGVARLYLSGQLSDGQSIAALNKTLKYIASDAHVNEYDNNLNNESLQVLVNRFKGVAKDDLQQSMDKSNARQLTVNQDYNIVPIDNSKEAAKYGKYTSWCVTHQSNMYDSYTNNGTGRFYFCLRNGFEKEPKVEGEGCPLDRYGLSMIAVSVTMEGEVNTITCRWNHGMGGNDNIMTIEQLEDLLGRNFYQTFKPYSREELHAKGIILFDEVQGLLDSGKKPEEIFDTIVDGFSDGVAIVKLNDKYNLINREGQLLSNQWFDYADDFWDGVATRVKLNNKYNFINIEGRLLSNQWFDYVGNFCEGFASVYLNNKWNFINREGQLLSNQWFDSVDDFRNGVAVVKLNNKYNFINIEGRLISNQWFDCVEGFRNGVASVYLNKKWYKINQKGEIVESKNRNKKTIVITEEQKKILKESILMDSLPEDITNSILQGETSLKNNPAIPNIFEHSYLEKVLKKRFIEVVDELKKIGEINDVPDTDIPTVLNKLILKCQEIEKPYRNELEKLCYNYLVDLFAIPDDVVTVEFTLVDEVDINTDVIKLDPVYGEDDEIEYEDLVEVETVKDEVYKRRMLDVLSMGAGIQVSSNIKSYLSDIYDIEPKLADLYRKILALNNYLLLTRENLGMTDENNMQIGTVEVTLNNGDIKPIIKAQGEIFPVLLCESVRGFMELFASHGLPKDMNILNNVLNKADYLKAEPWDMRIGPSLWTIMSESFGEIDFTTIPFVYRTIACLSCKNFNKLMKEVLAKTRTGKRLMGKVIEKAKKDKEYNQFSDKMSKLKTDKNVITDEYIHPDEL